MKNAIYVVGIPIGNIGDISFRAVETLRQIDFVVAENINVSQKLLSGSFNIEKEFVSYFQHNIEEVGEQITNRILSGQSCAIITDCGMPCISDPGANLVELCGKKGIETIVIPGPSAAISALAISGLFTNRFSFEGFLSISRFKRYEHLQEIKYYRHTLIFYEAHKKLVDTLKDLLKYLGNRRITIANDITKPNENILRTDLIESVQLYENKKPKGEYVLLIEGFNDTTCYEN